MPTKLPHTDLYEEVGALMRAQDRVIVNLGADDDLFNEPPVTIDELNREMSKAISERQRLIDEREQDMQDIENELEDRIQRYSSHLTQMNILSSLIEGETPNEMSERLLNTLSACLASFRPHPIAPEATTTARREQADQEAWTSMFDGLSRQPEYYGLIDAYKESFRSVAAKGSEKITSDGGSIQQTQPSITTGHVVTTSIDQASESARIWTENDPIRGIDQEEVARIRIMQHTLASLICESRTKSSELLIALEPFKTAVRQRRRGATLSSPAVVASAEDDTERADLGRRVTIGLNGRIVFQTSSAEDAFHV